MKWLSPRAAAIPAPYVVAPTWQWDGDDGRWTTFEISAGTPRQSFRVLPSTSSSETWLPDPDGCGGVLENITTCPDIRGVESTTSRGFETNASTTWSVIGIYELTGDQDLFRDNDTGLYGEDVIQVASSVGGDGTTLESQIISSIVTTDFWLGNLGLGISSSNFDTKAQNITSLLSTMKNVEAIPSLSFGYTAGASYSNDQTPGSLVLGGYDSARFTPSNVSFPLGNGQNLTIGVDIQSIIGQNSLQGTSSFLQTGSITATIDSSVSALWLPQHVCDLFAEAFGLTYDLSTGLYLVNGTIHEQLVDLDPSITFSVSPTNDSTLTTNIELPYLAFDLNVSLPIYSSSTRYFPIRVASSADKYILGRTFLQEAYLFVDWERQKFTVGQAVHRNATTSIVPVQALSQEEAGGASSGLSTGAIAGVVVGCVVLVVTAVLIALLCIRRRRQKRSIPAVIKETDIKASELDSSESQLAEPMSSPIHEADGAGKLHPHHSGLKELQGDEAMRHELETPVELYPAEKDRQETPIETRIVHELP